MNIINSILGIEQTPVSHAERLVSTLGGFISIFSIFLVSDWILDSYTAVLMVASMGASAVLLFAVPHGPLSQPWPVLGGHIVSALIGVTCAQWIPHEMLAASVAVGLSIGAMYYLGCIHPPGGATALSAVVGGSVVHELGYQYVIAPVLINVVIILLVGIVFNYVFPWRRYPVYLHRLKMRQEPAASAVFESPISHDDFVYALSQIDSFIDITEHDLLRIYDIATKKSQQPVFSQNDIKVGHYYSNGEYGDAWSVRQIVDASPSTDTEKDIVVYKVVAGQKRRSSGYTTRKEFLQWAKHQVIRDEENWKRLED